MGTVEKLAAKEHSELNIGDIVFLRSGSPALTVSTITGEGDDRFHIFIEVTWISNGKVLSLELPAECFQTALPIFP
jgi:hypothetical protein